MYIPALFNTDMVQALQRTVDPKTQTRRLTGLKLINENPDAWSFTGFGTNPDNENDKRLYAYFKMKNSDTWTYVRSPYGNVGDVLWVRETWSWEGFEDNYVYKADGLCLLTDDGKWYPSIFMPKQACRLWLNVTKVRMERLNDISEADAVAEGIEVIEQDEAYKIYDNRFTGWASYATARGSYFSLFESINSKEIVNKNPYVWVYDFEKADDEKHWQIFNS